MASIQESVSFTRPADTNAYAANDVMNADSVLIPVEHNVTAYANKQAWLMGCQLISSSATGSSSITRHYFSSSFAIAADNAAFNPSDSNIKDYYLGSVTFDTWIAFGSNKKSQGKPTYPFSLPMGKYYTVQVADAAYTPISGEIFTSKDSIYQE